MTMPNDRRRPRLQDIGDEPDYRFTLANERTFLAWIRTALSLLAGGVAVVQFVPELGPRDQRLVLGFILIAIASLLAGFAYRRWFRVERAMRLSEALPATSMPLMLSAGVAAVIVVSVVLMAL
jgi:putative membrane protein